jgi:1,4-dihydroxy-2-naphthoate octaprenyltransferase
VRLTSAAAWIRAARLPAQVNIAVPLLFGASLAGPRAMSGRAWDLALVFAFGLLDQLYIVFANDVADVATDRENRTFTPFSGGSRVLVTGAIARASLLRAAVIAILLAGAASVALAVRRESAWPVGLWGAAVALLWAYSFGPRLSYRGGGELLQIAGTAVVLPLFGFVALTGSVASFPWAALGLVLPIRLAAAIATALPDEPSDRAGGKATFVVALGGAHAGILAFVLACASIGLAASPWSPLRPAPAILVVPLVLAGVALALREAQPGSRTMIVRVASQLAATIAFEGILIHVALAG